MSTTRRQILGRGAILAGAGAIPGSLLAAAPALAQESDETDALEPLVELEQGAELAYSIAAEDADLDRRARDAVELFASHCGDHATALSEALDQLGVDPPEADSDVAGYERLRKFDPKAEQAALLEFMAGLELDLVGAYQKATPKLEAEDLVRTAAQIGAAHAQMLVALRLLLDAEPKTLTELG